MKHSLLFFLTLFLLAAGVNAQNTSPYWSLAGNSNTTNSSILGTLNGANLNIYTNGTRKAIITSSGLVGIGTGSPLTKLHVNGFGSFGNRVTSANAIRAINLADDNAVLRVLRVDATNAPAVELISRTSADGANKAYWDFYAQPSDASFRIRDRKGGGSGLDRVTISGSGNVGIGTVSPSYKLHVQNTGTAVYGNSTSGGYGVYGTSTYLGVYGVGADYGVYGYTGSSTSGTGVYGYGNYGVYGSGTYGVYGSGSSYGLYSTASDTYGYGVYATSPYLAVYGYSSGSGYGTYGVSGYLGAYGSGSTYGTYGYSYTGTAGAYGYSSSGYGVQGYSYSNYGGYFTSYNGTALYATATNGFYAAIFDGNTFTYGTNYTSSDRNIKKNIQDVGNAMSIINKLKPKNYEYKNDGKYASLNLPKGSHYGLIAQELEEVLPNLVSEVSQEVSTVKQPVTPVKPTGDGKPSPIVSVQKETKETISIKGVNYTELIPILVKAIQEQEAKIDALTELVDQLKNSHSEASVKLSGASLSQNSPNPPVASSTRINYQIPLGSATAELIFTNAAGQRMKQVRLDKNSPGFVDIDTSALVSGTYFYTLFVNGKSIDTRKMIVNKY